MTNNKTEGVLDKLYNYIREELMFSTESGRQPREGKNVAYYNVLEAIEDLKKNMEEPSPPPGVEQRAKEIVDLFQRFMPKEIAVDDPKQVAMYQAYHKFKEWATQSIAGSESQGQEAGDWKAKYEKCIQVIKRFDPGIIGMYDL